MFFFSQVIGLCNHYYYVILDHFCTPPERTYASISKQFLFLPPVLSMTKSRVVANLLSVSVTYLSFKLYTNEIIHYVVFFV